MIATDTKQLGFLQKSPRFVNPTNLCTYSWTAEPCRHLWDDFLRAAASYAGD